MENLTPSAEQARLLAKGPFPDYPFAPKSFVHPNGLTQSYLDEGQGEVVLMLHGNPSWSYYWRKLVLGLRDFVFDHHFLKGFTQALPKAEVHAFEDAGHYVLEDKADVLVPAIRQFLDRH